MRCLISFSRSVTVNKVNNCIIYVVFAVKTWDQGKQP